MRITRSVRDDWRRLGGRFSISESFVQILFGDVCVKAIAIESGFIWRINDCVTTALNLIDNLNEKELESCKHYAY